MKPRFQAQKPLLLTYPPLKTQFPSNFIEIDWYIDCSQAEWEMSFLSKLKNEENQIKIRTLSYLKVSKNNALSKVIENTLNKGLQYLKQYQDLNTHLYFSDFSLKIEHGYFKNHRLNFKKVDFDKGSAQIQTFIKALDLECNPRKEEAFFGCTIS